MHIHCTTEEAVDFVERLAHGTLDPETVRQFFENLPRAPPLDFTGGLLDEVEAKGGAVEIQESSGGVPSVDSLVDAIKGGIREFTTVDLFSRVMGISEEELKCSSRKRGAGGRTQSTGFRGRLNRRMHAAVDALEMEGWGVQKTRPGGNNAYARYSCRPPTIEEWGDAHED